jgi:hypothetical protein
MSIWGPLPVENDDAADWMDEFSEEPTVAALKEAFDDVLSTDSDEYLEIPECSISIAAASVVRDLFKPDNPHGLEDKDTLATLSPLLRKLDPAKQVKLIEKAKKCVHLVMHDAERSEILQMMRESPSINKAWLERMNSLFQDLSEIEKSLK